MAAVTRLQYSPCCAQLAKFPPRPGSPSAVPSSLLVLAATSLWSTAIAVAQRLPASPCPELAPAPRLTHGRAVISPQRVPARRPPPCAPCSKLAVEAPCTLPIAKSPASRPGFCRVFMLTVYPRVVRRARAPNRFLARHDVRCPACFAHPRRLLANAPTHQLTLSYPRPHATVVVFVEFANALLPIRLSSLLCASLRARRMLSVVPQHSCLPLARVNTRAPARCYCVTLALRPSGFTCARVCRRAVEPVLPCRHSTTCSLVTTPSSASWFYKTPCTRRHPPVDLHHAALHRTYPVWCSTTSSSQDLSAFSRVVSHV